MAHARTRSRLPFALMLAFVAILPAAAPFSAASAQDPGAPGAYDITVVAEVVEADAPVDVAATAVTPGGDGLPAHGVQVTWNGSEPAMLDDARFSHHVTAAEGEGDLVIAGRGCAPSWNADTGSVMHQCTTDFQLIELAHGETHVYPVRLYREIGPLTLAPGVYAVEETISWWRPDDQATGGEFTIRLVYTVSAVDGTGGVLTPAPAPSGISSAVWSGGSVGSLPVALSYWTTDEGTLVGYLPGAPPYVNARFLALFPGGHMPAGTIVLVVR